MEELDRLLLNFYSSARSSSIEEFENFMLGALLKRFDVDSATWGAGIAGPDRGAVPYHIRFYHEEPGWLRRYEEVKDRDLRLQMVRKAHAGVAAINAPAVYRGAADRAVLEFMKKYGRANSLIAARFEEHGRFAVWVGLHRTSAAREFSRTDQLLLGVLFPHVMEALQLNRSVCLDGLRAEQGARYQFALADGRGHVYCDTAGFSALLRLEWPHRSSKLLPDEILLAAGRNSKYVGRAIVIRFRLRDGLLYLSARPRSDIDALSERELGIAKSVANGMTYKEIAKQSGLAPATVRNHIQAIHGKLRVHNRAALTTLVLQAD